METKKGIYTEGLGKRMPTRTTGEYPVSIRASCPSLFCFTESVNMPRGHAAGKPVDFYRKIKLLPDGTMHSANEISTMFGVSQSTLSRKVKAGKKVWTREELREWAIRIENHPLRRCRDSLDGVIAEKPVVIRNIDDVICTPGPMERALMGVR